MTRLPRQALLSLGLEAPSEAGGVAGRIAARAGDAARGRAPPPGGRLSGQVACLRYFLAGISKPKGDLARLVDAHLPPETKRMLDG